jgi:hypothetical protein
MKYNCTYCSNPTNHNVVFDDNGKPDYNKITLCPVHQNEFEALQNIALDELLEHNKKQIKLQNKIG